MSTDAAATTGSTRRDGLAARAREIPRGVWVMAVLWGVLVRLLMAPWTTQVDEHDSVSMLLTQVHLNAAALFTVALTLAPLVAVLWPGWGLLLGVLGLLPLNVYSHWALQLSTYAALLGVAACGGWWRGACLLPALLGLVVPAALCFSGGGIELVLAGNEINSVSWAAVDSVLTFLMYASFAVFAVLMHWAVGSQRAQSDLRAAQAKVRQQQAEVRNEAVAVDERARLARDLHDIVAHRISLVAVRAETAPYTHPAMDDQTRQIFTEIAADARTALEEMRGVLGVLHRSTDAGVRTPQPAAVDIPDLVEDARSAGVAVLCSGELPPMSDAGGSVAYRVVQEALTNARRHGTGRVTVELSATDTMAVIRVSNPCGEAMGAAGRGLTGMRERLSLVNGSLRTEMCEGVFVLTAMLPRTAT